MKRQVFVTIGLVLLFSMSMTVFKASAPPLPNFTIMNFTNPVQQWWDPDGGAQHTGALVDFYDYKYAVYQIIANGGGYYNDGPFYPEHSGSTQQNSQYLFAYPVATYAAISVKYKSTDDWSLFGLCYVSVSNSTITNGTVTVFNINMSSITAPPVPIWE